MASGACQLGSSMAVVETSSRQPLLVDVSCHEEELNEEEESMDVLNDVNDTSITTSDSSTTRNSRNYGQIKNGGKGCTWYEASFLMINATLGAGLLNFPSAYERAGGVVQATCVMGVVLVFVLSALLVLAHCARVTSSMTPRGGGGGGLGERGVAATYQEVVLGLCGPRGHVFCSVVVAAYMFGACVAYLVVVADQSDRAFASLYGPSFCHVWYLNRKCVLPAVALLFVLPMCFSKKIDFLKYPSALGVLTALYLVFLVLHEYHDHVIHPSSSSSSNHTVALITNAQLLHSRFFFFASSSSNTASTDAVVSHWTDVFLVVPVICFGFQCHISAVPIFSCMRRRSLGYFARTATTSMVFCACAYGLVGAFGSLTFSSWEVVPSDVLLAYDAQRPLVLVGVVALALKTLLAYPILLFCGRSAVDSLLDGCVGGASASGSDFRRRLVTSSLWFFATLFLAVVTPTMGVVVRGLGSLAALLIFVFPGACLLHSVLLKDPKMHLLKDRMVLLAALLLQAVGAFTFGVLVTQVVTQFQRDQQTISLCQ